ncbi:hypothetical protein [Gordoniibacillus kamchatkensis]|uniref:hypothetical protein n=1 Tax=Gordoniibacillus kamchatkensis TaxID=1590651 RepID=UPI001E4C66AE|nr:hypothetical protein [Paenibacillus sp. VKM B-2647]
MSTGLTKVNDAFLPMIEQQLVGNGINMDGYSRQCVMAALSAMNAVLDSKGLSWNDPQLDRNNVTQTLLTVAALKLNAAASPREVFFQLRNVQIKSKDEHGKEITVWKKQIEMGIEGDGNDAILARFGRNVKEVRQFWLIRDGDDWEYPQFNGLEMTPPKWTPKGRGEVVRVVYPIIRMFGDREIIEYYISERDDVTKNLIAHINNNLMNETFGIVGKRYDATPDQKKKIDAKKAEILNKAKELGLGALDDPELQKWISPAWTEFQSREAMIIRKMRNNIVKKIPKDFGNAFIEMIHSEATDDSMAAARREVEQNANKEVIDVQSNPVNEPAAPVAEHSDPESTPTSHSEHPFSDPTGKPTDDTVAQQDLFMQEEIERATAAAASDGPGF